MGSPRPDSTYIASDADYVDYITELMGGFAIPCFLKAYRHERQYCLLGLRLLRDTERMVLSDIIYGSATPAGWALIPEPTPKERRFCQGRGIEIIEADIPELLAAAASGDGPRDSLGDLLPPITRWAADPHRTRPRPRGAVEQPERPGSGRLSRFTNAARIQLGGSAPAARVERHLRPLTPSVPRPSPRQNAASGSTGCA